MLASLFLRREKKSASEPALGSYLRPPDVVLRQLVFTTAWAHAWAPSLPPHHSREAPKRRGDQTRSGPPTTNDHNGALR